jgi:ketosteroid isomerase-like protein
MIHSVKPPGIFQESKYQIIIIKILSDMKKLILFAAIISCLLSCNSSDDKVQKENVDLVKKYLMAVENKDTVTMANILGDNYEGYGPSVNDSTNKEDAINDWKYNLDNLYESIKYTRSQNMALTVKETDEAEAGEWVTNWAYLTIRYKDGRGPINVWVNAVYKIENGKIVKSRTFYNEADVLRQLGFHFTK